MQCLFNEITGILVKQDNFVGEEFVDDDLFCDFATEDGIEA